MTYTGVLLVGGWAIIPVGYCGYESVQLAWTVQHCQYNCCSRLTSAGCVQSHSNHLELLLFLRPPGQSPAMPTDQQRARLAHTARHWSSAVSAQPIIIVSNLLQHNRSARSGPLQSNGRCLISALSDMGTHYVENQNHTLSCFFKNSIWCPIIETRHN